MLDSVKVVPLDTLERERIASLLARERERDDPHMIVEMAENGGDADVEGMSETFIETHFSSKAGRRIIVELLNKPDNTAAKQAVRNYIMECKDGSYRDIPEWESKWRAMMADLS